MKSHKRFLALLLAAALTVPAGAPAEFPGEGYPEDGGEMPEDEWLAAEQEEEYWALSMWMAGSEGTVRLFDREGNPLELDGEMSFRPETILETEEESLAAVDMDRERLAIMDETSRAGFDKADGGDRIGITLQTGAMYFRVGQPLEENESFDVVMDDIRLAIRGTCGMVQQIDEGMSILLASGHAVVTREPEGGGPETGTEGGEAGAGPDGEAAGEPGEITIEAGESVSVTKDETGGGIRFEKKKLAEDEVPPFLLKALRRDPEQLEKVYAETGWQPEKLFGDDIPVWMLPAEELDGIPDAWIGKVYGAGGWYRLYQYYGFPEKGKITVGTFNHDPYTLVEKEYPIVSVRQYTAHFYELSYQSGSRTEQKMLALPGITDEETARLKECLRLELIKGKWETIQGKKKYALISGYGHLELFLDDITAAGASGAKPFVDFQPSAYVPYVEFGIWNAELPDFLVGKTLTREISDTGYEETCEFISKSTIKYSRPFNIYQWVESTVWHADDYRELTLPVMVHYISDHFLVIDASSQDGEYSFFMPLMIPGMSEQELAFCRECIALQGLDIQPSSVPIDGNHYCTYSYLNDKLVITNVDMR